MCAQRTGPAGHMAGVPWHACDATYLHAALGKYVHPCPLMRAMVCTCMTPMLLGCDHVACMHMQAHHHVDHHSSHRSMSADLTALITNTSQPPALRMAAWLAWACTNTSFYRQYHDTYLASCCGAHAGGLLRASPDELMALGASQAGRRLATSVLELQQQVRCNVERQTPSHRHAFPLALHAGTGSVWLTASTGRLTGSACCSC